MAQVPNVDVDFIGDGVRTIFDFDFEYLTQAEVFVSVDGALVSYTWLAGSTHSIELSNAPLVGAEIRIYRSTLAYDPRHVFQGGVPFLPRYVDENNRQMLFVAQESIDTSNGAASEAQAATIAAALATSTANSALTASAAAVTTADAASAAAAAAVSTANAADSKADAAILAAAAAETSATSSAAAAASAASSAATAATSANEAIDIANGVDGKATSALENAAEALNTANQAMELVTEAGVQTFNGRSGVVLPLTGDYEASMILMGASNVADILQAQANAISGQGTAIEQVDGRVTAVDQRVTDHVGKRGAVQHPVASTTEPGFSPPLPPNGGEYVMRNGQFAALDPWSCHAVGELVAVQTHLGAALPPTDRFYRYVLLTASNSYNAGVLTGETVSGSAPTVLATAVVSLAGSPLNGATLRLINSERRFLRAGDSGVLQDSQVASHTHAYTDPLIGSDSIRVGSGSGVAAYRPYAGSGLTGSTGGDETRVRNIGVSYLMRIL